MRKPGKIFIALLLAAGIGSATLRAQQELYPLGPEGGRMLAADLRTLRPEESSEWKGVLKIRGQDRKTREVPVTSQAMSANGEWQVVYVVNAADGSPAQKLTVIHTPNGPNQYLYAVAPSPGAPFGEPRKLSGAEADIPLGGSDFWLSDLGFEFYHWPEQRRLKPDTALRRGRSYFVLESVNPNPKPGGYARVLSFIDKETGGPLEAEAYSADGKLLKQFELGSFKRVNGKYELRDMKISNEQARSRTQLEFDLGGKN